MSDKIAAALDQMEKTAGVFGNRVSIGSLTIACAVGYLDFLPGFPLRDRWLADLTPRARSLV